MIYFEELKLYLNDAWINFIQEYPASDSNWPQWAANKMTKDGLNIDKDILASLLREAETAYQEEPQQEPRLDYLAHYIVQQINT